MDPGSAADQNPDTNADQAQKTPVPQPAIEINIDQLDFEAGTHSRPVHEDVANEYADLMETGTVFPPVEVYVEGGRYFLADGFHRAVAAQRAGQATIPAHVHPGGRLDALKFALGANETHGLRRSIEDKRFAVQKALVEFPDWSDRFIAELCRVSPTFVGERRKEQEATVHVDSSTTASASQPARRVGRDGKARRAPRRSAKAAAAPVDTESGETSHQTTTVNTDARTEQQPKQSRAKRAVNQDSIMRVIQKAEAWLLKRSAKLPEDQRVVFWKHITELACGMAESENEKLGEEVTDRSSY